MNALVERLLRAEPLRHVAPNPRWAEHEVAPSLLSRSPFYRTLWSYARAWREAAWTRDARAIRAQIGNGWLVAEDDDQLFELFVLSRLVEVVYRMGPWEEFSIRPSTVKSEAILEAKQEDTTITIRYDRAPRVKGAYSWLFSRYQELDVAMRRPDLQLTVASQGSTPRTCLIEVKATTPDSQYGRDSVYKVLGYLKDYEALWEHESAIRYPRAVVVFATNVTPKVGRAERVTGDEVLISSHSLIGDDLAALVPRLASVD